METPANQEGEYSSPYTTVVRRKGHSYSPDPQRKAAHDQVGTQEEGAATLKNRWNTKHWSVDESSSEDSFERSPTQNAKKLSERQRCHLVRNLSSHWKDLAREGLSLPQSFAQQVLEKWPGDLIAQAREFLDMWIAKNGSRATATVIAAALRDIDQGGLAEEIEDIAEEEKREETRRSTVRKGRRKQVVPALKQLTVKEDDSLGLSSADEPVTHKEQKTSETETMSSPLLIEDHPVSVTHQKHILVVHDERDRKSTTFVQSRLLQSKDLPDDVKFVDRKSHMGNEEAGTCPEVTETSNDQGEQSNSWYLIPFKGIIKVGRAVWAKVNKLVAISPGYYPSTTGAYKCERCMGIVVVLPAHPCSLDRPKDQMLLDVISREFEKGSLPVMCIKMKDTRMIPSVLRCSLTVDYKRRQKANWQRVVGRILSSNSLCQPDKATSSESETESKGETPQDSSPLPAQDKPAHSDKHFPSSNVTFDCRDLTFHKAINRLQPLMPVMYCILAFQLAFGLGSLAIHCSNNRTTNQTSLLTTLIVVFFTIRLVFPLAAVSKLCDLTKATNNSLTITIPENALSSLYRTIRKLYHQQDLQTFTVNNAMRRSEMNLDRGLCILAGASGLHSLLVTVELLLAGVLDVDTYPFLREIDFIGVFISLLMVGMVLTQNGFEIMISGYRLDFDMDGTQSDKTHFKGPYEQIRHTWNGTTMAAFLLSALLYVIFMISDKDSFPFKIPSEQDRVYWIIIAITFSAADLLAFCAQSKLISWLSVPMDFILVIVMAAAPSLLGGNNIGILIKASVGDARHLLLLHLILVRIIVVFLRPMIFIYCHWPASRSYPDILISLASILGLVLALWSWICSIRYSI